MTPPVWRHRVYTLARRMQDLPPWYAHLPVAVGCSTSGLRAADDRTLPSLRHRERLLGQHKSEPSTLSSAYHSLPFPSPRPGRARFCSIICRPTACPHCGRTVARRVSRWVCSMLYRCTASPTIASGPAFPLLEACMRSGSTSREARAGVGSVAVAEHHEQTGVEESRRLYECYRSAPGTGRQYVIRIGMVHVQKTLMFRCGALSHACGKKEDQEGVSDDTLPTDAQHTVNI